MSTGETNTVWTIRILRGRTFLYIVEESWGPIVTGDISPMIFMPFVFTYYSIIIHVKKFLTLEHDIKPRERSGRCGKKICYLEIRMSKLPLPPHPKQKHKNHATSKFS